MCKCDMVEKCGHTDFVASSPKATRIFSSALGCWKSLERESSLQVEPPWNWWTTWQESGWSDGVLCNWKSCRKIMTTIKIMKKMKVLRNYHVSTARESLWRSEWSKTVSGVGLKWYTNTGTFLCVYMREKDLTRLFHLTLEKRSYIPSGNEWRTWGVYEVAEEPAFSQNMQPSRLPVSNPAQLQAEWHHCKGLPLLTKLTSKWRHDIRVHRKVK